MSNEAATETQPPRKEQAARGLGYTLWFAAHVTVLLLGIYLFGASLLLKKRHYINRILYRVNFAIVAATYATSVYHYLEGELVRPSVLLAMDSVQYAVLAGLWIFMPTHASKTLPFTFISLLHVLDTVAPASARNFSKPLSLATGYANIAIFFKLIGDFFRLRHGATISLLVYGFFYRIRFQFSPVDKECASTLFNALDNRLSAKSTPEKLRQYWTRTRKRIQHYESVSVAEARKKEEDAIKRENAKI